MGETNLNKKYLFPNGRQAIDYIADAGLAHGYCIGHAVICRYKAGIETDPAKQEKLMRDCNWYIDQVSSRENIVREEVVSIVKSIVGKMEKDRIESLQTVKEEKLCPER